MSHFFNLILILFIIITINACTQESQEISSQTIQKQSKQPQDECSRETKCLRLPLHDKIDMLDPGLAKNTLDYEIIDQLFLGLVTLEKKTYEVKPELATRWEMSSDGKVYTFFLRQEVKWSDGEPFTAHDVVWTIQRNLKKEEQKNEAIYIIENANEFHNKQVNASSLGVRAIDDYTVEFKLNDTTDFLALTILRIFRPLPRHVFQKSADEKKWVDNPKTIPTNGPYQLEQWRKGYRIVLKKNPYYYAADKVNIHKVQYHIVSNNQRGLAMYENNELDIMGGLYLKLPYQEIFQIKADVDLSNEFRSDSLACTEWYGLNPHLPPTNDLSVRKAIVAAIDKQLLIDVATTGKHFVATTVTPSWIFESNENNTNQPNISSVHQKTNDELKNKPVRQLVLTHKFSNSEAEDREQDNAVKTLLKHFLQLELEVRDMDYSDLRSSAHIFHVGWCGDFPNPYDWLVPLFYSNDSHFGWLLKEKEDEKLKCQFTQLINKEDEKLKCQFTQLINQARKEPNPSESKKLYRQAERILTEEAVVVMPIYSETALFLVKPWVKNWYNMPFGGQRIRDWSLSESKEHDNFF